jgi:hypothetical protein
MTALKWFELFGMRFLKNLEQSEKARDTDQATD